MPSPRATLFFLLGLASHLACDSGGHPPAGAQQAAATSSASGAAAGSVPEPPAPAAALDAPPSHAAAGADAGAPDAAAALATPPDGMVRIAPGIFLMGTRMSEGDPEEWPMHEVIVAAFFLDKTEVTADAFRACVQAGTCTPPYTGHPYCTLPLEGYGNHPITCVDYHHAESYCTFVGKRLPTEREWEYAARGGGEQRRYSWGEEPPDQIRACYDHRGSCPVASFPAGAFGLFDMSGNVWEWTSSWYGPYPDEHATGQYKVYRGGSWSRRFPKWLRNAIRNRYLPHNWSASIGFRCARSILPPECPDSSEPRESSCVRTRGTPLCEPFYAWNGSACTPGGLPSPPKHAGHPPSSAHPGQASAAGSAGTGAPAETPITRTRTPQFDKDCRAHWPQTPHAYRFSGGTFYSRNPVIRNAGCSKRDMGGTWTSACCAD